MLHLTEIIVFIIILINIGVRFHLNVFKKFYILIKFEPILINTSSLMVFKLYGFVGLAQG